VIDKKFPKLLDVDKARVASWDAPMAAPMRATQRHADEAAAAGGVPRVSAGETVVLVGGGRAHSEVALEAGDAAAAAAARGRTPLLSPPPQSQAGAGVSPPPTAFEKRQVRER
jgi:hypothetical protein